MLKGLIIALFITGPAFAETIYKYKDENGRTVYSNIQPRKSEATEKIYVNDKYTAPVISKTQKKKPIQKNVQKKAKIIHNKSNSAQCRYAKSMLSNIDKQIRTGKGTMSIEQLRDNKRKYTDFRHKNC